MGKWSRHPLGSDQANDIQDIFMSIVHKNPDSYYFELEPEEIRKALLSLTESQIREKIASDDGLNKNRFVIPYSFLEYNALPIDKNIRDLLKDCLNYRAIFTYKDHQELNHIARFIKHFDEVFDGKYNLDNDEGLIQAFNESKKN